MSKNQKLRSCPFCGGEARGITDGYAFCDCGASAPIEAWNIRSVTAAAVMGYEAALEERTCEVVTSELAGQMWVYRHEFSCDCGQRNLFTTSSEPPRFCPNCGAKAVD